MLSHVLANPILMVYHHQLLSAKCILEVGFGLTCAPKYGHCKAYPISRNHDVHLRTAHIILGSTEGGVPHPPPLVSDPTQQPPL